MAGANVSNVCDLEPGLLEKLRKFRHRKEKNNAALVLKIDSNKLQVTLDEEFEDISVDDLIEELPDHLPRYVVLSYVYHHDDGRVSYPLAFIFISPQGCKPHLQMMYAGSKLNLTNKGGFTKVFEARSKEEVTEEWLKKKLAFFR